MGNGECVQCFGRIGSLEAILFMAENNMMEPTIFVCGMLPFECNTSRINVAMSERHHSRRYLPEEYYHDSSPSGPPAQPSSISIILCTPVNTNGEILSPLKLTANSD